MSISNPEPGGEAACEAAPAASGSVELKRSPADLHLENLPLAELGDAEALAHRLVDDGYLATLPEARVAAAELTALARATRGSGTDARETAGND